MEIMTPPTTKCVLRVLIVFTCVQCATADAFCLAQVPLLLMGLDRAHGWTLHSVVRETHFILHHLRAQSTLGETKSSGARESASLQPALQVVRRAPAVYYFAYIFDVLSLKRLGSV
jgi:hypothetical protein